MDKSLEERLDLHEQWLGKRDKHLATKCRCLVAKYEDLSGVDFQGRNLKLADFEGCNLQDANFYESNLRSADFAKCNLRRVDFRQADLVQANFKNCQVQESDFGWARMERFNGFKSNFLEAHFEKVTAFDAVFDHSNLAFANFDHAFLRRVCFLHTDLAGADFRYAVLLDARLENANIDNIKFNFRTQGIHPAPEGTLIGWGKKSNHLVKFLIPKDAKRSRATSRKHRASYVFTLEITNLDSGEKVDSLIHDSKYGATTRYAVKEKTYADTWDPNRWDGCSHGIHFFLSEAEARSW